MHTWSKGQSRLLDCSFKVAWRLLQVFSCSEDLDVLAGCECRSDRQCYEALIGGWTPECKEAVIRKSCDDFMLEKGLGINLRNLYQHILNDCLPDSQETLVCDASVRPLPAGCSTSCSTFIMHATMTHLQRAATHLHTA